MAIKKDGTGNRWVEMEFVTPGTPEAVWQAMATGPGNAAWFTRATIDGRVGGALRFDFGPDMGSTGEVTAWEPPRRFGYVEREWMAGAPPVATEITITSRSGGKCVVRMVHSLFASTDDWDDQLESFEKGWPAFFEVLRLYLAHFAGRRAAILFATARVEGGDHVTVWKQLIERVGLAGMDAGERWSVTSPETLSGSIERIEQASQHRYVLLRLAAPQDGIATFGTYDAGGAVNVGVTVYCYGDDAARRAERGAPLWREWLAAAVGQDTRA